MEDARERVGLFIDGHHYHYVDNYLSQKYGHGGFLNVHSLHECLEKLLSVNRRAEIIESHLFAGRPKYTSRFDQVMESYGVNVHTLPVVNNREKGIDVLLALTTYSRALELDLDTVVLVSGDADFIPLVKLLQETNVSVVVPYVESDDADVHGASVANAFWDYAEGVSWEDVVRFPEGNPRMVPIFTRQVARDEDIKNTPERRFGVVTHWVMNHGFVTDSVGAAWYVHVVNILGNKRLRVGDRVQFSGSPHPTPGQKYPTAQTVVFASSERL